MSSKESAVTGPMPKKSDTQQSNMQQLRVIQDLKTWHYKKINTTDSKEPASKQIEASILPSNVVTTAGSAQPASEQPETGILKGSNTSSKKSKASVTRAVHFDDRVHFDDGTDSSLKAPMPYKAKETIEVSIAPFRDTNQYELKREQFHHDVKDSMKSPDVVQAERKTLQVLNLTRSNSLADSLGGYFLPENIGKSLTLKNEISDSIDPSQKFSDKTDLCIVFYRKDLSLPHYLPEEDAILKKIRSNRNLKIIQIEVERGKEFSAYVKDTIAAIQKAYTQPGENAEIKKLKAQFAARAEAILSAPETTKDQKQKAFYDLVKSYIAIEAYQKIDKEFKDKHQSLSRRSLSSLDMDECIQEEERLKTARDEEKKKQLKVLSATIKEYYPGDYSQFLEAFGLSPNYGVEEKTVEEKTETTVAISSASQLADMSDEAVEKQSSGSVAVADADIEKRLKEMEKHTFFRTVPAAPGNVKKDVKKMMEKTDSLSSALFQPALAESENVKKEVEQMMEKVEPIYSSP